MLIDDCNLCGAPVATSDVCTCLSGAVEATGAPDPNYRPRPPRPEPVPEPGWFVEPPSTFVYEPVRYEPPGSSWLERYGLPEVEEASDAGLRALERGDDVLYPEEAGKVCRSCWTERAFSAFSAFPARATARPGSSNVCRVCTSARVSLWVKDNPERARENGGRGYRRRRAWHADVPSEPYTYAEIAARDGWGCSLCPGTIDPSIPRRDPGSRKDNLMSKSFDHVVPMSRGGSDLRDNVRLAHLGCNMKKGNREESFSGGLTNPDEGVLY